MANLELSFLVLSFVSTILTVITALIEFIGRRRAALAKGDSNSESGVEVSGRSGTAVFTDVLTYLTIAFITITLVIRGIRAGHAPFSNMYEFALSFAWGVAIMGTIFQWRYKTSAVKNIGLTVALLLIIFTLAQSLNELANPEPLVPALQQSVLLSAHVASAMVAYGTFTIGFGAAILYLIQNRLNSLWLPNKELLDTMSYQSVIVGFPFMTLLIILGALWADIAWGRYWGWDPKETASLVTWLLYAAYLHARVMRGWRGPRVAILLIVSFIAVLLTFFGNYIFSGLHAYG